MGERHGASDRGDGEPPQLRDHHDLSPNRKPVRELARLRVKDVDLGNKVLAVRQKKRRDRLIPLVDNEVKALRNYLRYRATELVLDDDSCPRQK